MRRQKDIFILYLGEEYGGGGRYVEMLVKALLLRGKAVNVIAFFETPSAISVQPLCRWRANRQGFIGWMEIIAFLCRRFKQGNASICIATDHRSIRLIPLFKALFPSIPWVYFLQSSLHLKEDWVRNMFRRFLFRFPDGISAVSKSSAESIRHGRYAKNVNVVYCAVPASSCTVPVLRSVGSKNVILLSGRLTHGKGHADLLEASRERNWEIWFAGEGNLAQDLAKKCENRSDVKFLGWVGDMVSVYRAAAVVVLPSYSEALGLAIMEAMACGKPVVAYDIEAIRELVENGKTGLLVPVGDREALANAIQMLLDNPQYAARMGAAAQKDVEARFTLERMGKDVLGFLKQFAPL